MTSVWKHPRYVEFPAYSNNARDSVNHYLSTTWKFTNPFGSANWYLYVAGLLSVQYCGVGQLIIYDETENATTYNYIFTEGGNGGSAYGILWQMIQGSEIMENMFTVNRAGVYSLYRMPLMMNKGNITVYWTQDFIPTLANCRLVLAKT